MDAYLDPGLEVVNQYQLYKSISVSLGKEIADEFVAFQMEGIYPRYAKVLMQFLYVRNDIISKMVYMALEVKQ